MSRRGWWVAGIAAGAFMLRWLLVSTRGDFLEFDETFYLLIARSLREGKGFVMNSLPQIAFPPLPAFLLAASDRLFGSMIAPSWIASAIFGALLVVPIWRVARRWIGRRAGIVAALLVAVCPTLMAFVPLDLPHARRLHFGHEPLHILLVYLTLWSLLGVLRRPSAMKGLALGASAALAYLSRNESILFGGAAVLLACIAPFRIRSDRSGQGAAAAGGAAAPSRPDSRDRRGARAGEPGEGPADRSSPRPKDPRGGPADRFSAAIPHAHPATRRAGWAAALCAAATLVVVAAPYPIYLHHVTGAWAVTGKTGTASLIRPTIVDLVRKDDFYAYEKAHYALAPSGDRMLSSYWGWAGPQPKEGLGLTLSGIGENVGVYLGVLLPAIVPWPLWPFILVALARYGRVWRRRELLAPAAVALLLLPSLVVCVLLFVEPRHHLYLVPAFLMFAAGGCVEAWRWPRSRMLKVTPASLLVLVLLAMSVAPLWALARGDRLRAGAAQIRMMGEVLARELPPGEPVVSYNPALAWWAGREWRVVPSASLSQIVGYVLRRGARSLVVERGVFGSLPGQAPGETAPFGVYMIEGLAADQADRSMYRIDPIGRTDLYATFRISGPGAP